MILETIEKWSQKWVNAIWSTRRDLPLDEIISCKCDENKEVAIMRRSYSRKLRITREH